jgi:maltooligosyltrehalose trehalohydrolase
MNRVEVWAPNATAVDLWLRSADHETSVPMAAQPDGWFAADTSSAGVSDTRLAETDYGFRLELDGSRTEVLPDPRSRRQPHGVHQPSRFYPDDFEWTDQQWAGAPLPGAVFYELHVGTFTPGGTFDSAIDALDHLVRLGVTHVELLPVNDFNGVWNWGYDGVLWYAVHEAYGGPDGLKRFVDACHRAGLAVTLDVVYNHLGPSGNYLPQYGPYLKSGRNTWGDLLNLDGPSSGPVREYILDNTRMWFEEFHVDALRLDAVHALQDSSPTHLLAELSARAADLSNRLGRPLTLVAESDLNDPVMITPRAEGGYGLDGQWDDDVHHALHALLTGERHGYYADFGSLACLAKVLTRAFFHDGTFSSFRGRPHGKPVDREHTPGYRFVVCLQNHDQVGNRAAGDRLTELTSRGKLEIGAVLLLTSPFTPLLFMGEEWAARTRWPFFTSHPEPELAEATGKGRIAEFADHGWDVSTMLDPQDPAAFAEAHLDWEEPGREQHRAMLDLYRRLIQLRRSEPDLSDPRLDKVVVEFDQDAGWVALHRGTFLVLVNLAESEQALPFRGTDVVLATGPVVLAAGETTLAAESAAIVRT